MKLTDKLIREGIRRLKSPVIPKEYGWLINPSKRVLSSRYRKKGRPRKKDYDYVPDKQLINKMKQKSSQA